MRTFSIEQINAIHEAFRNLLSIYHEDIKPYITEYSDDFVDEVNYIIDFYQSLNDDVIDLEYGVNMSDDVNYDSVEADLIYLMHVLTTSRVKYKQSSVGYVIFNSMLDVVKNDVFKEFIND